MTLGDKFLIAAIACILGFLVFILLAFLCQTTFFEEYRLPHVYIDDVGYSGLRALKPPAIVTTFRGKWKLLSRTEKGETWEDLKSGLVWLPSEARWETWDFVIFLQNEDQRLPTIEEFKEAKEHDILEILGVSYTDLWWTVSPDGGMSLSEYNSDYYGHKTLPSDRFSFRMVKRQKMND